MAFYRFSTDQVHLMKRYLKLGDYLPNLKL